MTEQIPTPEEYRLLEKTLMEKVLERSANDPQWRQWLIEDPETAMREAAFPEAQMLKETDERIRETLEDAEVVGHLGAGLGITNYPSQCRYYTYYYDCNTTSTVA